jgi:RecB family exonuclease
VSALSYSGLADYARCGYRFYLQRVLRLPEAPALPGDEVGTTDTVTGPGLTPAERGTIVHALLERLDFRVAAPPSAEAAAAAVAGLDATAEECDEIAALIGLLFETETFKRLAAAAPGSLRREEGFAFLLGDVLINGVLDAVAREPGERVLVVDYKSDRLEGRAPEELMTGGYLVQRLIYALAALRSGARSVEVRHLFLERPNEPATATFEQADADRLERELRGLARGALAGEFRVAEAPHRGLCSGCPGEGGLCSWPTELTRREAADRLF